MGCTRILTAFTMAYVVTITIAYNINITVLSPNAAVSCTVDEDILSMRLSECYKKGDKLLIQYHKHVHTTRRSHQDLDKCLLFSSFTECIESITDKCPAAKAQIPAQWRHLLAVHQCACSPDTVCHEATQCFEGHYGGILGRRCEALFRFNVKQRTRKKCHFLQEYATCKEKLLTSACGHEAGALASYMTLLYPKGHVKRTKCHAPDDIQLKWFSYTTSCPPEFPIATEACFATYIKPRQVAFYAENDLIVDGSPENIQVACNDIISYRSCVEPIRRQCPDGVKMVEEFGSHMRTYLIKMDSICGSQMKVYSKSLSCYSDVLMSQSLQQCQPLWQDVEPMLHIVTAYDFFCVPTSTNSQRLQQNLDLLRACYNKVFMSQCGQQGGDTIAQMIKTAFSDPFYLRYKYKPNCEQHQRLREYNEMRAWTNQVSRHQTRDTSHHEHFQDLHNNTCSLTNSSSSNWWLSTSLLLILFCTR